MKIVPILILCAAVAIQALPRQRTPRFEIRDGILVRAGQSFGDDVRKGGMPTRSGSGRIVGGENAQPHSAPHKVSLQWGTLRPAHFCAGMIIHSNWILSAGHCVAAYPDIGISTVVAGLHDLTTFQGVEQIRHITHRNMWTHDNFDAFEDRHDIGLILFQTPFEFNFFVNAIALPAPDAAYPTGVATMHGWGSTSTGFFPVLPNILQTANLVLVPLATCQNNWEFSGVVGETHVCAGSSAASACMLDDGGALVQNNVSVALLSWGNIPCGLNDRPAIFTRISSYISWIDGIMATNY